MLETCSWAQADSVDILSMANAFGLNSPVSPRQSMPESKHDEDKYV